jgi:hypothetical protein
MYNITAGIFSCFSAKKSDKRVLTVNHSREKRDKMEMLFPVNKYNSSTKENFVLFNLYINFKEGPSSLMSSIEKLRDLDIKKALAFKNEIINYRKFLKEDIDRINIEESVVDVNYMINEYRNNKIHWFTLYFYLESSNEKGASMEELSKSRINGMLIRKIEHLLLYVSFSEDSKKAIKELMQNRIKI